MKTKSFSGKFAVWAFAFLLVGVTLLFIPRLSLAHYQYPQAHGHYRVQGDNDENRSYTPWQVYRLGYERGLEAGRDHGIEDSQQGENFNYFHSVSYRRATEGWSEDMGFVYQYRRGFRAGYKQGYREGYYNSGYNHDQY